MEFLKYINGDIVSIFGGCGAIFIIFKLFIGIRRLIKSGYKLVKFAIRMYDIYLPMVLKYAKGEQQRENFKMFLGLLDEFTEQLAKTAGRLSVDKKTVKKLQNVIKKSDYSSL